MSDDRLTLPDFGCHILVFWTVKLSDCFTILFLGCSGLRGF
ncbi:MAG: hypothetical protein ACI9ZX_002360, partial [Algoriphagus sp.]